MKNLLLLVLTSSLFFSCKKSNLEQVWIGQYCYIANDSTYRDACPREIYAFEKDSVSIKEFDFQLYGGEDNSVYKYPYEIEENKLRIFKEDRIDTIDFKVEKDLFEVFYSDKSKITYQPLPRYNQVQRKNEFRNYLLNASFEKSDDSLRIEFQEDNRFIKDKLEVYFSMNERWILDEFGGELFLVFAYDWTDKPTFFHIKEFNENGFKGISYGREDITTTFKKLPKKQVYNPKDFIGKWERYYAPNHQFQPIPPFSEFKNWVQKEQVIITDSTLNQIIHLHNHQVNWTMNREQDVLLFSKWRYNSSNDIRQWNILEVKENQFTIKRWNRLNLHYSFGFDFEMESVTFIKAE